VAGSVAVGRLLDWLLLFPFFLLSGGHWQYLWNRMIWLPLPSVQSRLEDYLEQDWSTGVYNLNQVLAYTLQFIPAVAAANAVLARSPGGQVLARTASLAEQPFDWELLHFCSANLSHQLRQKMINGFFLISENRRRRWINRYPTDLRLDTPVHSACAGFWLWHENETEKAVEAFAVTRPLRHGEELYGIARAIVAGKAVTTLPELADWQEQTAWLDVLPDPELRPGALQTLRILRNAANGAKIAHHSQATLNRSTALGRASAELKRLLDTDADFCPEPEWPLLKGIARRWLDILIEAGGVVGEEVLRQPALNPYEGYSGLPVIGPTSTSITGEHSLFVGFLSGHGSW